MSRSVGRAPVSFAVTVLLFAGSASLAAQRPQSASRTWRLSPGDSAELQLRRLQRSVDSLARLYDDEDLSANERHRVGLALNRAVAQFEQQQVRVLQGGSPSMVRGTFIPRIETLDRAGDAMEMVRAFTPAPQSKGWIGMVVNGAPTEFREEDGELFVRYLSYPRVASVDPSSPAQRAGIVPNDTLVAFDGRDVRDGEISMTRLLQPKATVVVRVRHEGRMRDLPVVVVEVPSRIKARRTEEIREVRTPWPGVIAVFPPNFPGTPAPPAAPPRGFEPLSRYAPTPPSSALTPVAAPMFPLAPNGIAGAMMVTVTEGLSKTLGLSSGVLITFAPPSSPASESGLRDGDVIVKVNGDAVRAVADVRELIARAVEDGERSVVVDYVREKKARKAKLRW